MLNEKKPKNIRANMANIIQNKQHNNEANNSYSYSN